MLSRQLPAQERACAGRVGEKANWNAAANAALQYAFSKKRARVRFWDALF